MELVLVLLLFTHAVIDKPILCATYEHLVVYIIPASRINLQIYNLHNKLGASTVHIILTLNYSYPTIYLILIGISVERF